MAFVKVNIFYIIFTILMVVQFNQIVSSTPYKININRNEQLVLVEGAHYNRISSHSIITVYINNLPIKIIYKKYKMPIKNKTKKKQRKSNPKIKKTHRKKDSKTRKKHSSCSHKHDHKISTSIKKVNENIKKTDMCAVNSDGLGYTCYSKSTLMKIRDLWNKKHPDHKIVCDDPYIIWKSLRSVMEHEHACKRESCWLKHLCVKEGLPSNIYDLTFSPEMPESWLKNPNEWLSSLDIVKVMTQWERKYSCFKFIGPSPIDYDSHRMFGECVWDELCEFSLKKHIANKHKKIGVIFNLDPHYKSGSHWVALFINVNKKTVYYFDSYGDKPPAQIKKFINTVIKQSSEMGEKYKYLENKKRHQFGHSECGMYSMYFITQMIRNKCFEKFQRNKITDNYMLRLRKRFFNKPI